MSADGTLPIPADVRSAVERVLSLPEFQGAEQDWLSRSLAWLADRLDDVSAWIDELLSTLGGGGVLQWLLIGWLGLSLLAVLAHLLWTVRSAGRAGRAAAAAASDPADGPRGRSPAMLLAQAERAAAEGRFEPAMHLLYLGTLAGLDAQGRLHFRDGKTGGEYLAELAGVARGAWAELLVAFYPVAFGGRAATAVGWTAMRAAATAAGAVAGAVAGARS